MEANSFPRDLIELQAEWQRTCAALAVPRPVDPTVLRRRLQVLSGRLLFQPYWSCAGTPAARAELRRQARGLRELP